jgi:hypothetical protein
MDYLWGVRVLVPLRGFHYFRVMSFCKNGGRVRWSEPGAAHATRYIVNGSHEVALSRKPVLRLRVGVEASIAVIPWSVKPRSPMKWVGWGLSVTLHSVQVSCIFPRSVTRPCSERIYKDTSSRRGSSRRGEERPPHQILFFIFYFHIWFLFFICFAFTLFRRRRGQFLGGSLHF